MSSVAILGKGCYPRSEFPRYLLESADHLICCDGAFGSYLRHKHPSRELPDVVIGDLDSLSKAAREKYSDIIVHVREQDDNDQTKALRYALDHYCKEEPCEIHFLGSTGAREDHTVGNMSLLMEYERQFHLSERGIKADIISDWSTMFAVTDTCTFYAGAYSAVSIFSPDNTLKIKSTGLRWKTDEVVFDNWWKATLNKPTEDYVRLEFSHPSMALIVLS